MIGTTELIIIAAVIMLLFGSAQLPKLARSLGNFINEFNEAKDNGSKKKATAKKKKTTKKKAA
jgi:sec-independent protein translocase protein TatA